MDPGFELAAFLSAVAQWPRLAAIVVTVDARDEASADAVVRLLTAWQSFFPPAVFERMAVVLTRSRHSYAPQAHAKLKERLGRIVPKGQVVMMDDPLGPRQPGSDDPPYTDEEAERAYERIGRGVVRPLLAIAAQKPALYSRGLVVLYSLAQQRQRLLQHCEIVRHWQAQKGAAAERSNASLESSAQSSEVEASVPCVQALERCVKECEGFLAAHVPSAAAAAETVRAPEHVLSKVEDSELTPMVAEVEGDPVAIISDRVRQP